MDNKEHHFCFAYKGERMRITPFESLHFQNVQGTSTIDGMQLIRISLHKRNGRRANTIPKIIKEYNEKSGTDPVVPVKASGMDQEIACFKIGQTNAILLRIEMDRSSSRFWSWDAPLHKPTARSGSKRLGASIHTGLEGLVRELNLDPSTLCMQSAYDQVAKAYFQIKGTELKNSGAFPAEDKEFILAELRRHFDRERMFIVAPPSKEPMNTAAKAITNENFMADFQFKKGNSSDQVAEPTLNETVVRFFTRVAPKRSGVIQMTFKEILDEFNSESVGIYRRTCILPFMQPLIEEGVVEVVDSQSLRMDLERIRMNLKL